MENQNQTPAPVRAFMILGGMMNSQVVAALIKTNIIESLGSGPKSTEELAEACQVNQNVLSRTLRFAVFLGIVNFTEGKYSAF